nr:MAG TPA: hypothetical protein [Caudoviricetes sp.]
MFTISCISSFLFMFSPPFNNNCFTQCNNIIIIAICQFIFTIFIDKNNNYCYSGCRR